MHNPSPFSFQINVNKLRGKYNQLHIFIPDTFFYPWSVASIKPSASLSIIPSTIQKQTPLHSARFVSLIYQLLQLEKKPNVSGRRSNKKFFRLERFLKRFIRWKLLWQISFRNCSPENMTGNCSTLDEILDLGHQLVKLWS